MAAPHSLSDVALLHRKAELRARARVIRAGLSPALGAAVTDHVLGGVDFRPGACVAGIWPLSDEIDLRALWYALHERGQRVLLPETPPRGNPLVFRHWTPGTDMVLERFGTQRPVGDIGVPEIIFVPFLAFDAAGHRLGYGGGYYDRTLAALTGVPAIGVGFAALQVDSVPVGPHDRPLDAIFTEQGLVVTHGGPDCGS
jgi:5-formyltetrahydrofolate cyclo-ligase